jgi:hypothetical protein
MTRALTLVGFALIAAFLALNEWRAAGRNRARFVHALDLLARHPVGKWLVLAGWLWLGWHLFARSGAR